MNIFKKVQNIKNDYTTYPKTLEQYRWYKPILVFIASIIFFFILISLLEVAIIIIAPDMLPNSLASVAGKMNGFDSFIGIFGFTLISLIIPAIYLQLKLSGTDRFPHISHP